MKELGPRGGCVPSTILCIRQCSAHDEKQSVCMRLWQGTNQGALVCVDEESSVVTICSLLNLDLVPSPKFPVLRMFLKHSSKLKLINGKVRHLDLGFIPEFWYVSPADKSEKDAGQEFGVFTFIKIRISKLDVMKCLTIFCYWKVI